MVIIRSSPLRNADTTSIVSEPPTPTTPSLPEGSEGKQKRNPLTDLVETERAFVEQLTGIIRAGSNRTLQSPILIKSCLAESRRRLV